MSSLTIRNLEEGVKEQLRLRAAMHGHSMEQEARVILKQAVGGISGPNLWQLSRALFSGKKGAALALASRSDRAAPDFDA